MQTKLRAKPGKLNTLLAPPAIDACVQVAQDWVDKNYNEFDKRQFAKRLSKASENGRAGGMAKEMKGHKSRADALLRKF